jgi:nitrogen fixation protein NifZ
MSGRSAAKSKPKPSPRSRPIARVVCDAGKRRTVRNMEIRFAGEFQAGEPIRSIAVIKNDGMYPHRDVGEALVHPGDAGVVRESWRFLGEVYYTVEFVALSVFVIMRGYEMTTMGTAFDTSA